MENIFGKKIVLKKNGILFFFFPRVNKINRANFSIKFLKSARLKVSIKFSKFFIE